MKNPCSRCGKEMTLRVKKYVCNFKCEAVKSQIKKSEEEHTQIRLGSRSRFFIDPRIEFQEIYMVKAVAEKYWDSAWNGR